jgi:hypothetical protein
VRGGISRTLRALVLLTGSTMRRLLREGLVLRSMVWPGLVICLTLAATLLVTAAVRPGRSVVVAETTDPSLVKQLEDAEFVVWTVPDVVAAIKACRPTIGIAPSAPGEPDQLWVCGTPPSALEVEAILRTRSNAVWRPVALRPPDPKTRDLHGDVACRMVGLLFVLYGVVFGLGSVARDRDDGSLEAELALPIPRWVGGAARWVAASAVLATFYSASVLAFAALIPIRELGAVVRHGVSAASVGVAIGLSVVGTAGLKNGFSGPLAVAMTGATALVSIGAALTLTWLPIASLLTSGDGWSAVGTAILIGVGASALYGWRVGGA